jgi:hypothetical protein
MMKDDHQPSYGMIGIHRMQCSGSGMPLFNSTTPSHTVIAITIKSAVRQRHLSNNWLHGREVLAEVYMSPAQFAELITTPNMGDGVACTIRHMNGMGTNLPFTPDTDQVELFSEEFKANSAAASAALDELAAALGDKPPRKVREALEKAKRELEQNAPFVAAQFERHMEHRMAHAKAEFDAFMTHAIHNAGLQALGADVAALTDGGSKE